MCRFNNNTKGILVTANEGGCNIFGGHFICNKQSGDIGVDVTGGWQTRIVGSKFEGGNGGTPTGHGVVIRGGEGVRVQAVQSESSRRGVWVSGGKNHYIEGYFSNYVSGCEAGVWVDSGASNVYVNALSGSDTSTRPKIKNRSSTTKVFSTSVTVSLLAKATANNRLGTKSSGSESRDALPLVQQKLPFTNHF